MGRHVRGPQAKGNRNSASESGSGMLPRHRPSPGDAARLPSGSAPRSRAHSVRGWPRRQLDASRRGPTTAERASALRHPSSLPLLPSLLPARSLHHSHPSSGFLPPQRASPSSRLAGPASRQSVLVATTCGREPRAPQGCLRRAY
eukprot:363401-Chlamydomonas_euryale.AAC.4